MYILLIILLVNVKIFCIVASLIYILLSLIFDTLNSYYILIRTKEMESFMIYENIRDLVSYGLANGLIENDDVIYVTNQLLELFELDDYIEPDSNIQEASNLIGNGDFLKNTLESMVDYAYEKGLIKENTITYRDLFDTKIMNKLLPMPSAVINKFYNLYKSSPKEATDFYYKISQDSDYIRRYRIKNDIKWVTKTEYGDIDITINLSKPEKDPKAIAAAKNTKQSSYPQCQLCYENVGYAGRINHPARQNHRVIPITINNQDWSFQYSPYVYYNEHCIVFNNQHTPMKIDKAVFRKLFDFVKLFPHYFVGSNADLPIVGGSILSHEHFQGGHYTFAMAKAPMEKEFTIKGYEDVTVGIVRWPMSVIRISSTDENILIDLADKILETWRGYSDETVGIYAFTNNEPHNTITPIARKAGDNFELDLVLRNNITTEEHPLGVFHPHQELHNIKRENIGLIEVMGLAVLPARLATEMKDLAEYILNGRDIRSNETLVKHADWVDGFIAKYDTITKDNIDDILKKEIGNTFSKVLEHAGVYKRDQEGQEAFERFISAIGGLPKLQ